jgi:hypothetical protein
MMKTLKHLHWFLIKFRVMSISMLIFVMFLIWDMWEFYQTNFQQLDMSSGGAFGAAWLALIGIIKFCFDHILKAHEKDEE